MWTEFSVCNHTWSYTQPFLKWISRSGSTMGKRSRELGDPAGEQPDPVAQALERAAQRASRVALLNAAGEEQLEEDHPMPDGTVKRPP